MHVFFLQIAHLKQQHTLGVTFEGIQIGRNGELCWILVRTKMGTLSAAVGIAFLSVWLCVCLCLSSQACLCSYLAPQSPHGGFW